MRKAAYVAALGGVLALLMAPAAGASVVEPSLLAGNPPCGDGTKIQPVTSGTYLGGTITITVVGSEFSFTTNGALVTSVIVKGGPNANLYSYPAPGVTSDSGLTAPINPSNGRPYGLSHLCVFTDDKKPPPPPPKK